MKEKLITIREVSEILGISEKEIIDLAKKDLLPHYWVGGEFLRFRKDEILKHKKDIQKKFNIKRYKVPLKEKIIDFLYFNDFYILSGILIAVLIWLIIKK